MMKMIFSIYSKNAISSVIKGDCLDIIPTDIFNKDVDEKTYDYANANGLDRIALICSDGLSYAYALSDKDRVYVMTESGNNLASFD